MLKKRVLISVSDKTGIVDFARALQDEFGYEIISTGGTKKLLSDAGLQVKTVEDVTGIPEMLDGRVKTLHPAVHGGLLAIRKKKEHLSALQKHGIELIDMVVVNLYPFQETLEKGASFEDIIEHIDIGGPSMLRSAAKNYESVVPIASPSWYQAILSEMRSHKGIVLPETRKKLASEVFFFTALYDSRIAQFLSEDHFLLFPAEHMETLRYGENPNQHASALKDLLSSQDGTLVGAKQWQGKALSFLNYYDADAALQMVLEFENPAVSFVKHGNPCGLATHEDLSAAFQHAYDGDPRSAFGVIIALNRPVPPEIAKLITELDLFVEVLLAPSFEKETLRLLSAKKNLRILELGELRKPGPKDFDLKKILGGYLLQSMDTEQIDASGIQQVTSMPPSADQMKDLLFAFRVVKHVKSNGIVLVKNQSTVGIGAGQMSRVDSTEIAVRKAGDKARGSVLASDAFFPFPDSIDEAAKNGVVAIIQPGGSVNDQDVIKRAEELKIPMLFTGKRVFKH